MSTSRFKDQRILVCGGATGIGAATVRLLVAQGAAVLLQYHTRENAAREIQKEFSSKGRLVDIIPADLTDEQQVKELAVKGGVIHGIVHAISAPVGDQTFEQCSWTEFEKHWQTDVRSAYLVAKHFLASNASVLSSLVFVLSSFIVGTPPRRKAPYVCAKYGLLGIVKSLAIELASREIRVNGVSPSFISTPLTDGVDMRFQEIMARESPMKKLATVEDAAMAIAFLLSSESRYVTGTNLVVGGGSVM